MKDARLLRIGFSTLILLALTSILTLFLLSHHSTITLLTTNKASHQYPSSPSSSSLLSTTLSPTSPLSEELRDIAFSSSDSIKRLASGFTILLPPPLTHVAAIIELRPLANLVPLVLHFSSVLGPTWPIHIFHSTANAYLFRASPPIARLMREGLIRTILIPQEETFTSHDAVSEFLAGKWFWEHLAPAENVLLFQADSILCSRSQTVVEDFLEWDFIGAPIQPALGKGYNGGLSLRKRATMLEVLERWNWTDTRGFEDQWFFTKIEELIVAEREKEVWRHGEEVDGKAPVGPEKKVRYRLPGEEVAKRFAVETIWTEEPFGLHQVERWHQGEHLESLGQWCPEYVLAGKGTLY